MKQMKLMMAVMVVVLLTACGGKKSGTDVREITKEDVERELLTLSEIERVFTDIKNNDWYVDNDRVIAAFAKKVYKPVVDDRDIVLVKNCNMTQERETQKEYAFAPVSPDSIASAVCFLFNGAVPVAIDINLYKETVYNMYVEEAEKLKYAKATDDEKEGFENTWGSLKSGKELYYKSKYYFLLLDSVKHQLGIRYALFTSQKEIREKMNFSNVIKLLDYIDDNAHASDCGLQNILTNKQKSTVGGFIDYIYGRDVKTKSVNRESGVYTMDATSDHACYLEYRDLGFSFYANFYFKNKDDADNFFQSGIDYGFKKEGRSYYLPPEKIHKTNRKNELDWEQLYMDKVVLDEGWYFIYISPGDFGD